MRHAAGVIPARGRSNGVGVVAFWDLVMADPVNRRAGYSTTTLVTDSERVPNMKGPAAEVTAFVIAWSSAEPERIGEVAIIPDFGTAQELGRGPGEAGDARLRFFRQRPASMIEGPSLVSPGLSRQQLLVIPMQGGARIERVGQCVLEVNGQRVDSAEVVPGDVIVLKRELVLFCTRRPAYVPPPRLFPATSWGAFGDVDAVGILGESPHVWRLRESIAFAAKADTHVMLLGESGTGKELAAHAIHKLSSRDARTFVARNAATLPSGLIDAELFGNAKNYPNPGMADRPGLIGEADGGSLFLDEIGELPVELQSHLLRVLDSDGEYQRLGEGTTRRSRLRIIAATNTTSARSSTTSPRASRRVSTSRPSGCAARTCRSSRAICCSAPRVRARRSPVTSSRRPQVATSTRGSIRRSSSISCSGATRRTFASSMRCSGARCPRATVTSSRLRPSFARSRGYLRAARRRPHPRRPHPCRPRPSRRWRRRRRHWPGLRRT